MPGRRKNHWITALSRRAGAGRAPGGRYSRLIAQVSGSSVQATKNGSMDTRTVVNPLRSRSVPCSQSALRWYVTPLGKFAVRGALLPQNAP